MFVIMDIRSDTANVDSANMHDLISDMKVPQIIIQSSKCLSCELSGSIHDLI